MWVSVDTVASVMLASGEGVIVSLKSRIASNLGVPSHVSNQWFTAHQLMALEIHEVFSRLLGNWVSKNGGEANIGRLTNILKDMELLKVAEAISELGNPETQIIISGTRQMSNSFPFTNSNEKSFLFGVKQPINNFEGRLMELNELNDHFMDQGLKFVVIYAIGGQGKTELCKKFIHNLVTANSSPPAVIWLPGENIQELTTRLSKLARRLSISKNDDEGKLLPVLRLLKAICKLIKNQFRNQRWLVVIDNVDEEYTELVNIIKILIDFEAFVLVTSRRNDILPGARSTRLLKLETLSSSEATLLVKNSLKDASIEDVTLLCDKVGNHALALQQSVEYIQMHSQISSWGKAYDISHFLQEFQDCQKLILQHPLKFDNYNHTIHDIVRTTMDSISKKYGKIGEVAQELGMILGLIHPDGIHLNILQKLHSSYIENTPETIQRSVYPQPTIKDAREAVLLLARYSVVSVNDEVVSIHRLVQMVLRLECEHGQTINILLKHINPKDSSLEELRQMISIWEHADHETVKQNPNFAFQIFNRMVDLSIVLELNGFAEKNQTLLSELLGPSHRETLLMEYSAGRALYQLGHYEVALAKLKTVLENEKRVLGEEHPSTLNTASLISSILCRLEKHEEALNWADKVLESSVKLHGENHLETMISRSNKALVLVDLDRMDEAMCILQQVLQWEEVELDSSHPQTLMTRHHIATICFDQKDFHAARAEFEEVLKLEVKILGEEHADTLNTKFCLANTIWELCGKEEAIKMLEEVLVSREKVLGLSHPDTSITRNELIIWKGQMEMDENQFLNVLQWKQKVVKGRRFLKGTPRLAISEEILSILPTTVVLFFFPMRNRSENRDESADHNSLDLLIDKVVICLEKKCGILNCEKILFLNQVVVPMFDGKVLRTLVNEEFDVNIMVDNPQCIARLSQDIEIRPLLMNTRSCNVTYSKDFFSTFDDLRRDPEKIKGQVVVGIIDGGAELNDGIRSRCNFENDMQITNQPGVADVGEYSDANTEIKHGTNIVRIVAQSCSPDTTIVVYQTFDVNLQANYNAIVVAFSRARKRGVDFLNCSFSIKPEDTFTTWQVNEAIRRLFARKGLPRIIPICSAGNNGTLMLDVQPPATSRHCVSVGAHTFDDCFCSFSSGRCAADIATFGEGVVPPLNRGETIYMKGTSFSTAVLTGFLTHVLPIGGNYYRDPGNIKTLLQTTAGPLRKCLRESHNSDCKKKLNVKRAYQEAKRNQSPTLPP